MLTTHELRVLYILRKQDQPPQPTKRSVLTQAMHRFSAEQRDRALVNCEELKLISSSKTPIPTGEGGRPGMVYWLTDEGKKYVQFMIDNKSMPDPKSEPRAGKKRTRA
jgi:hypothetical protein